MMERLAPVLKVITGTAGLYMVGVMGFWIFQAAGWLRPAAPVFSTASKFALPAKPSSVPKSDQSQSQVGFGAEESRSEAWEKSGSVPADGKRVGHRGKGESKTSRFEDLHTEATGATQEETPELDEAEAVSGAMDFAKNQDNGTDYGGSPILDDAAAKAAGSSQDLKKSQDLNGTYQNQWGPEFEGDYYPEDEGWDY